MNDITVHSGIDILVIGAKDQYESIDLILSSTGYRITAAENGRMALELLDTSSFDLILLDIFLSDMPAINILESVRKNIKLKEIQVIVIAPFHDTTELEIARCIKTGADDILFSDMLECLIVPRVLATIERYHQRKKEKEYLKRIEELSVTDTLTGLNNRRHFNNIIDSELEKASNDSSSLTLIMLDIDNFKKYNDIYGHQEGDKVLSKIGNVLKTLLRHPGEYCFRLGGEEFGCLLTSDLAKNGMVTAEKIRTAIEDLDIQHRQNLPSGIVTASLGVKTIFPKDNTISDQLYRMADQALYLAKKSGRNTVVQA